MRFRLGLILGFVIGYVLGSRAGRQRYEQIRQAWNSFRSSDPAQQLGADVRVAASKAGERVGQAANQGVAKVTSLVRRDNGDQHEQAT
jgi:hypothetical protein